MLSEFMERFERLKTMSTANQQNRYPGNGLSFQNDKPKARKYAEIAKGDGYAKALQGWDFKDKSELKRVRKFYRVFLAQCGLNPREADELSHSWEFAVHRYSTDGDGPSCFIQAGKGFMKHECPAWSGVLDLRNETALKIHNYSRELANSRNEKNPSPTSDRGFNQTAVMKNKPSPKSDRVSSNGRNEEITYSDVGASDFQVTVQPHQYQDYREVR